LLPIISIPDDIKDEDISDYISAKTGWCVFSWEKLKKMSDTKIKYSVVWEEVIRRVHRIVTVDEDGEEVGDAYVISTDYVDVTDSGEVESIDIHELSPSQSWVPNRVSIFACTSCENTEITKYTLNNYGLCKECGELTRQMNFNVKKETCPNALDK